MHQNRDVNRNMYTKMWKTVQCYHRMAVNTTPYTIVVSNNTIIDVEINEKESVRFQKEACYA